MITLSRLVICISLVSMHQCLLPSAASRTLSRTSILTLPVRQPPRMPPGQSLGRLPMATPASASVTPPSEQVSWLQRLSRDRAKERLQQRIQEYKQNPFKGAERAEEEKRKTKASVNDWLRARLYGAYASFKAPSVQSQVVPQPSTAQVPTQTPKYFDVLENPYW